MRTYAHACMIACTYVCVCVFLMELKMVAEYGMQGGS